MSLIDLLYPPACYHCNRRLLEKGALCQDCIDQLTLLTQEGHCYKCFCSIPAIVGTCKPCRKLSHPFKQLGACFDSFGPAQSLMQAYLAEKHQKFAKLIASYIVFQLSNLNYPNFQTITMVPNHFVNPHFVIGIEVAKMLEVPFKPLIFRKLSSEKTFVLKKKCNIINQLVLLIDLQMDKRETIRSAAWALDEGRMENLYGITFCATLH